MTPEHAFLDSIWEDLDDDATKLIFADWLEDQDDWRSPMLRWQVERNRHGFWTSTFKELHGRLSQHLFTQGGEWLAPLKKYTIRYSDGTGLLWLKMHPSEFTRLPEPRTSEGVHRWITEVSLEGSYLVDTLIVLDQGPQVRLFLNFSRVNQPSLLPRLAEARGLHRVRSLDLTFGSHASSELRQLVRSPGLANLQYLFLGYGSAKHEMIPYLVRATHLTNLRGLDLASSGLKDPHLIELVGSPILRGLTALYLEGNQFTRKGIEELIASPHLGKLAVLDLRGCKLDPSAPYVAPLRQRFPFVTL